MDDESSLGSAADRRGRISDIVAREQSRLRSFIRRRVADPEDVEDVLQDVFWELVEANRRLMPIDHISGWLFAVARNRITDLLRKVRPATFSDIAGDDELLQFADLLPSPDAGPDAVFARNALLGELSRAIEELPEEQRRVFVAHELESKSFNQLAAETGVGVNTLLSRKRYAVLRLRRSLQSTYDGSRKG